MSKVLGFVVGMSRAGTVWMSRTLNEHPDLAVYGETGFWGKHYVPQEGDALSDDEVKKILSRLRGPIEDTSVQVGESLYVIDDPRGLRKLMAPIADKLKSHPGPVTHKVLFDRMADRVSELTGKRYVIEKTPHHVNWVGRIRAHYPDAKFIVLVRDPYAFMLSYKYQNIRKDGALRMDTKFEKLYHPLACALVYRGYARSVLNALEALGDDAVLVRLEDVRARPDTVIGEVQRFLGVRPVEGLSLPKLNSSFRQERRELSGEDVRIMNLVASSEIEAMGYGLRQARLNVVKLASTALGLVPWSIGTYAHLSRTINMPIHKYVGKWLRIKR